MGGWPRTTTQVRRVLDASVEHAVRRGEDVSPECLLLALISESEGNAVLALGRLGVPLDRLLSTIPHEPQKGTPPSREEQLTREAKRAMDFAFEEVRRQKS